MSDKDETTTCKMCGATQPIDAYCTCPYGDALYGWNTATDRCRRLEDDVARLTTALAAKEDRIRALAERGVDLRADLYRAIFTLDRVRALADVPENVRGHGRTLAVPLDDLRAALDGEPGPPPARGSVS